MVTDTQASGLFNPGSHEPPYHTAVMRVPHHTHTSCCQQAGPVVHPAVPATFHSSTLTALNAAIKIFLTAPRISCLQPPASINNPMQGSLTACLCATQFVGSLLHLLASLSQQADHPLVGSCRLVSHSLRGHWQAVASSHAMQVAPCLSAAGMALSELHLT